MLATGNFLYFLYGLPSHIPTTPSRNSNDGNYLKSPYRHNKKTKDLELYRQYYSLQKIKKEVNSCQKNTQNTTQELINSLLKHDELLIKFGLLLPDNQFQIESVRQELEDLEYQILLMQEEEEVASILLFLI